MGCGSSVMAAKIPKTTQVAPMSTSVPTTVPRPLVLAGPSGAGKSTLIKKLFADHKEKFGFSVSHTTRKPRAGETHGIEYYFTTREEMKKSVEEGNFIESAEFAGNMYGTSKKAVQDVLSKGQVCILDIDMQGVRNIKKTDLNPVYILVKPPSLEELEKRLKHRGTETEESLSKRLSAAKTELEYAEQPGVFDQIIVNDTVDNAYARLREAIESGVGISLK
eukprot:Em0011g854a